MSSPRLGLVRDSMLTNPLILKAPLGQSKSRGLSVPGPDFTYGTGSSCRDGGVAEVLSNWRVQPTRGDSPHLEPIAPDFVSLNRDAVKSGLVTSKELSHYRAQIRSGIIQHRAVKQKKTFTSKIPVVPDITFGIQNRPSSPFSDLLSHQYGRSWFDKQLTRNQISKNQEKLQRIKSSCVQDNRTSLLRRSRPLPVTQTPFKLPHFQQVGPSLNTFKDQGAPFRTSKAQQSDSESSGAAQGLVTHSQDIPEEKSEIGISE